MDLRKSKLSNLRTILEGFGRCAIAFSGGVDSTFLLAAAIRFLGSENVVALTALPPYVANWEVDEARELAKLMKVKHIVLNLEIPESIVSNPPLRCYLCKKTLFSIMLDQCDIWGISHLCDGSNVDDKGDYRPGLKALKELSIKSPLLEAKLTKDEIRSISKEWNLTTWDKAPYACLLTRIPHDTLIEKSLLHAIEQSELILIKSGYNYMRVRSHDNIARIEMPSDLLAQFISDPRREEIVEKIKNWGFEFVTLDLSGYKMGSMNKMEMNHG